MGTSFKNVPFLVIITGESGAGKSTALKTFEDLNFLTIDNFPVRLLKSYLMEITNSGLTERLALVMDLRDPFFLEEFPKVIKEIREEKFPFELIYLTAKTEVLITRYNQTRRPHPLLKENYDIENAVKKEKKMLSFLKNYATYIIDTSDFNYHQLKTHLINIYGKYDYLLKPILHIIAFGFKYGIPNEANFIFDIRWLPNPFFIPELSNLDGTDERIINFLLENLSVREFINKIYIFLQMLIENFLIHGERRYCAIGIGCTGGRHRSVAIAKLLNEQLKQNCSNIEIIVSYRDIRREN